MNKNFKSKIIHNVLTKLGKNDIVRIADMDINAGGVYRVVQIGNKKPYICITTFRGSKTLEENKKNNNKLLAAIKSLGYHAYSLIGYYQEQVEGKEEKTQVVEESFFIPYRESVQSISEFIKTFGKIAKDYNQDSILVGLPKAYPYDEKEILVDDSKVETGKHYYYYPSSGKFDAIGTSLKPGTVEGYGSKSIDTKKNRSLEWKIVGTRQPCNAMAMTAFDNSGLSWVVGVNKDNATWYDSIESYLETKNK